MTDLRDTVALVTGAGSGIGRAIALALAGRGAHVCLTGRRPEQLEAAADGVREAGGSSTVIPADLTVDEEVRDLGLAVERTAGGLDILVHCASAVAHAPLAEARIQDLDTQYATNVRGPYLLTQMVLPMLRARGGQIVFVNSSVYLHARAGVGQYSATKYALKAIADSLREEVNADGIRVLTVFPGRTATPLQAQIHELEGKPYHPELLIQPEDVAAMVVSALTLPRTAEVTDISMRPMAKPG